MKLQIIFNRTKKRETFGYYCEHWTRPDSALLESLWNPIMCGWQMHIDGSYWFLPENTVADIQIYEVK